MFQRMQLFWALLGKGGEVADKAFWKKGQAYGQPIIAAIIMTLVALAKTFGYDLPIDDSTAMMIAGFVFFGVNTVLTLITTKSIGIPTTTPAPEQPPLYGAVEAIKEDVEGAVEGMTQEALEAVSGEATAAIAQVTEDVVAKANDWFRRNSK